MLSVDCHAVKVNLPQPVGFPETVSGSIAPLPKQEHPARPFPAIATGAFALFAFYFVWRRQHPRCAAAALVTATFLGLVYAGTQWVRGAHFVSHDLWSVMVAWLVCLGCYILFERFWPEDQSPADCGSA